MPSTRLYTAAIRSHQPAGGGYVRLVLEAPGIASSAVPGQFVMLRVTENLDPLLARPFGISSIVGAESVELYYRIAGRGTSLLARAEEGRSLQLLGPLGKGFPLPEGDVTPVLVAGGSGFPPLHFLVHYLPRHVAAGAHFFYGARNRDCLPPPGVLKHLEAHTAQLHLATDDGSIGAQGTTAGILNSFLESRSGASRIAIYACGPHAMLAAVSRLAAGHSIPCYVSLEERMACGLGACMGCSVPMKAGGYRRACKEGPVFDARDIEWAETVRVAMRQ